MNRSSSQFFAGATFTGNQNSGRGFHQSFNGPKHFLHDRTATDHFSELLSLCDFISESDDFLREALVFKQLSNFEPERIEFEGLGYEVGGAELHGFHRDTDCICGGEYDHRTVDPEISELRNKFQPVATRHDDIEQDKIGDRAAHFFKGSIHTARRFHVALLLKKHAQRFTDSGLVIDD